MIVLDAAALVDVVADQPHRDWVLERLREEGVVAPAHQPAEVLSAVARLIRAEVLSEGDGRAAIDEAMGLEQDLIKPTRAHLHRALDLQDRIRVLDGLYVALAEQLGAPLVTTDARIAGAGLSIVVLTPSP